MTGIDTHTLRSEGVLRTLASLYRDDIAIQALLVPLGVDTTRLRPFGSLAAVHHWDHVCTTIDSGAFLRRGTTLPLTLDHLLSAVLAEHPGRQDIAGVLARYGRADAAADGALAGPADDTHRLGESVRVLCLLAGPAAASRLRLRAEHRGIEEAARRGRERTLDIKVSSATRRQDVIPALLDHRPHILHFAGHGSANGYLLLEDDAGRPAPVHATALAAVLKPVGGVHTVLLTACHLGLYLDVISPYAHELIGAERELPDRDALTFSRGYYTALALGTGPEAAFALGEADIALTGHAPSGMRRVAGTRAEAVG